MSAKPDREIRPRLSDRNGLPDETAAQPVARSSGSEIERGRLEAGEARPLMLEEGS